MSNRSRTSSLVLALAALCVVAQAAAETPPSSGADVYAPGAPGAPKGDPSPVHQGAPLRRYVNGANLIESVEAPAVALYDNGPLVTHPGGGFGGADASAVQIQYLNNRVLGFMHAAVFGFRVADDFTVPTAWSIANITFFA